jgi:hypothetical protein|tara:strand:+ start:2637 stop:2819 length:183 start_codon:yes stop_codon:yes gene_type:complete
MKGRINMTKTIKKEDQKWVSQIISKDTQKLLERICKDTMRTKPTQLHLIVKEYYEKLEKV